MQVNFLLSFSKYYQHLPRSFFKLISDGGSESIGTLIKVQQTFSAAVMVPGLQPTLDTRFKDNRCQKKNLEKEI